MFPFVDKREYTKLRPPEPVKFYQSTKIDPARKLMIPQYLWIYLRVIF